MDEDPADRHLASTTAGRPETGKDASPWVPLRSRAYRGALWQFAGTGTELSVKILAMIALARILAPEDFGVAGAATLLMMIFYRLCLIGIGPSLVRETQLDDAAIRAAFIFVVSSSIAVAALVSSQAELLAALFLMPELRVYVEVSALFIVFSGLGAVAEALLLRTMQFRALALAEMVSFSFGYGVIAVTLALLEFGAWSLVAAMLAQSLLKTSIVLYLCRHPKLGRWSFRKLVRLLRYGFGFSLAEFANLSAGNLDYLVVGRWMGAEALGFYGRAYQLLMIPAQGVGKVADKVLFATMSSISGNNARLARGFLQSFALVTMISTHLGFALLIVAPELIVVALGSDWEPVILPFQILCAVLAFRTASKVSDSLVRATGYAYSRALCQWIYAAAVFVFAYIGHLKGLPGVAVGVAAAMVLNFLLMLYLVGRIIPVKTSEVAGTVLHHAIVAVPFAAATLGAAEYSRYAETPGIVVVVAALGAGAFVSALMIIFVPRLYGHAGERFREFATELVTRRSSVE